MIENKEVMARNIRYYMTLRGVNSADVCKALGFKQNTFSNWINAKIYPRIDKIEKLAKYFNITKADLVEPFAEMETTYPDSNLPQRVLIYLNTLKMLSPEARERVFHYIEYEKLQEDSANGKS